MSRLARTLTLVLIAIGLGGCSGGSGTSGAATAQPAVTGTESGSAAPGATPTPDPNLLASTNGTVIRSYPSNFDDPSTVSEAGAVGPDGAHGPYTFVFELPGVAQIAKFQVTLGAKPDQGEGESMTIAVSTDGADSGFHDVGTASAQSGGEPQDIPVSATGRWIRITANSPDNHAFAGVAAFGTLNPPASPPSLDGAMYVETTRPYADGTFKSADAKDDPWYVRLAQTGSGLTATQCSDSKYGSAFPGKVDGRVWSYAENDQPRTMVINDDASLIGTTDDYYVRTDVKPTFCMPRTSGSGAHQILVLDDTSNSDLYPMTDPSVLPGYQYSRINAGMLDSSLLNGSEAVIINGICISANFLSDAQGRMLLQWVADGHKLMIYDSDMCGATTAYSFLPYPYTTVNPGAGGARGDRLIQVDSDQLGTADKTDTAHFYDPSTYAKDPNNQLGDANTTTTTDDHWCGHLFGTNSQKVNGFMQMYALYQKGVIIYDGFDHDDGNLTGYQRMRQLEFALPIPNGLTCAQPVSLAFLIQPSQDGTFVPGTASTLSFPMEVLANQGWNGHINVTATGDFPATITPSSFDMSGGTQAITVAVQVPADAKPGTYALIVSGDGGNGKTAQATINLTANVPIAKQLTVTRRIRIYGIHFDVDKAIIQPQSETVIAQIAQIMRQNPAWRFRVEGHTDSDGGADHNLVLSQHRAQAVVTDLVNRYHIAASRLVPVGYGLTRPVAPNTTTAGKALNRRVELYRL